MEIHDKKIYYHWGSLKNPIFKCVCVCVCVCVCGGGGSTNRRYIGGGKGHPHLKKSIIV